MYISRDLYTSLIFPSSDGITDFKFIMIYTSFYFVTVKFFFHSMNRNISSYTFIDKQCKKVKSNTTKLQVAIRVCTQLNRISLYNVYIKTNGLDTSSYSLTIIFLNTFTFFNLCTFEKKSITIVNLHM